MSGKATSAVLPLPFVRPLPAQAPAAALPLPFTRRLGDIEDGGQALPEQPQNPWRDPARPMVSASFGFVQHRTARRSGERGGAVNGAALFQDFNGIAFEPAAVSACMQAAVQGMESLKSQTNPRYTPTRLYTGENAANISGMADLRQETRANTGTGRSLASCRSGKAGAAADLRLCRKGIIRPSESMAHERAAGASQQTITAACVRPVSLPALPVPCEWYEIPAEPELPAGENTYVCGIKPKSNRIPFRFNRRRIGHDSATVPLPFACFNDFKTPVLKAYMIVNTVSATFDGKPLTLLAASFSSDTGGYCWQGSLTVPPDDFVKLDIDGREKGGEALITVKINGESFAVLAEEYRDNRAFGQKSYTVSGRSQTARLGENYAVQSGGLFSAPVYARQIADSQLKNTGIRLTAWEAADWLIPADVYSSESKTPIAVLQELAAAAGAFVESHPQHPEISIKPRWKKPVWEAAAADPDVTVPASVVLQISGARSIKPQANGVFVYGDHAKGKGADVFRRGSSREPRASAVTGALYTDAPVLLAAGLAALSDTGTHKTETVTLPVSDKYALPLAEKGQIWQIQEPSGAWQGVVTGVTLAVDIENDAPRVLQTVVIDRYLDA